MPMISVVIPAYNAESFLAETLDSVFSQTFRPREVIVVDDGSSDRTLEIANSTTPPEGIDLICLHKSNAGPSAARNHGVKAAVGDWIAFLDADDLWTPNKLALQVDYLSHHPEVGLLFCDMSIFDQHGERNVSAFAEYGEPLCTKDGLFQDAFAVLLKYNPVLTGTVIVQKACIEEAGFFDETIRHGEDYDLWLRVALLKPFACLPEVVMRRRIHEANLSGTGEAFYHAKFYILRKLYQNPEVMKSYGTLIRQVFLKEKRELSYFFYLRRRYLRATAALGSYAMARLQVDLGVNYFRK